MNWTSLVAVVLGLCVGFVPNVYLRWSLAIGFPLAFLAVGLYKWKKSKKRSSLIEEFYVDGSRPMFALEDKYAPVHRAWRSATILYRMGVRDHQVPRRHSRFLDWMSLVSEQYITADEAKYLTEQHEVCPYDSYELYFFLGTIQRIDTSLRSITPATPPAPPLLEVDRRTRFEREEPI